jgi:two-component system chemotaxis sensor kinase CheA
MVIDLSKFIRRFIEETRDHLDRFRDGLNHLDQGTVSKDIIDELFRAAHTIKGSARMLKLASIAELAHYLEDALSALRENHALFNPSLSHLFHQTITALDEMVRLLATHEQADDLPPCDKALCQQLTNAAQGQLAASPPPAPVIEPPSKPTADQSATAAPPEASPKIATVTLSETVRIRLTHLDALINLIGDIVSQHERLRLWSYKIDHLGQDHSEPLPRPWQSMIHDAAKMMKEDMQHQQMLIEQLHDNALALRLLPLAIVFEPVAHLIRDLAQSIGKQVRCQIDGAHIELDRQMIDQLADPLVHLLRNAIDHGIETPERRRARGKPLQGQLHLRARQEGSSVVIEISDDGGGISLAAIREKVVRKGLLTVEQAAKIADHDLLEYIFLPGFSTNQLITDLSGRGVGMDVVKQCIVNNLHGSIDIRTDLHKGTTFALRLPLSLAMMRVLLVMAAGHLLAFTAQYIVGLARVTPDSLLTIADRHAVIIGNEFIPVFDLAALLKLPPVIPEYQYHGKPEPVFVIIQIRQDKFALQVDQLVDERDMVIKALPEHLRRLPLVAGMVSTPDQTLVSILHLPKLLHLARHLRYQPPATTSAATATASAWHLLVVDDSLNTREVEKEVLEAHGYRVTLAKDGLDGLTKALAQSFDAILTDVEMPNMDGFTLTERLRQESQYQSTPIVIVTSRETEQDKQRGVQVGADAYILKGDFDQNNLITTLHALLG